MGTRFLPIGVAVGVLALGFITAQAEDVAPATAVGTSAPAEGPAMDCPTPSLLDPACPGLTPRWSVDAGLMLLHRSNARPAVLVEDGRTDRELADVADFDLGFAAGPRLEFTRSFDCGWELGVGFFGIDGWDASRRLEDAGNLRVPLVSDNPVDYFDTASASYTSQLYSTELNVKRRWNDRVRLLGGFRWVELHESIAAQAYSPTLEGNFGADTRNHLYGFQLGTEATLWDQPGPFRVDGFLKAGIYGNHIDGALSGHGTNFDLSGTGTHNRTSFLGEVGVTATFRLTPHCSFFGGYEAMWIEGISLAGDVVAALESPDANVLWNGTAFYHGALAGLKITW